MDHWDKFWWQSVGGARTMTAAAALALYTGKSAVIPEFAGVPWPDTFRELVEYEYFELGGAKGLYFIDAEQTPDPGAYMISLLSNSSGFRPTAQSPASYIKSRGELNDRVFWVQNISAAKREAWCVLCKELAGKIQFALELMDSGRMVSGAEFIPFGDYTHDYDFSIYALAAAFSRRDCGGPPVCRYIAELASLCHERDAVGILESVMNFDPDTEPSGQGFSADIVWHAQIKTAYHILEEERRKFISRYRYEIMACLPQYQYGETIDEPENAEFALLWFLSRPSRPIPNLNLHKDDDELLLFLRNARNNLAHGKVLPAQDLARLLGM